MRPSSCISGRRHSAQPVGKMQCTWIKNCRSSWRFGSVLTEACLALRRNGKSERRTKIKRCEPAKEKVHANGNVPERNHRERRGWKISRLALGAVGTEDCGGRTTLDWWLLPQH